MIQGMPTLNSTVTLGIQYSPPGAPVNSGAVSYSVTATSRAQSVGQIDVTSTDEVNDTFSIPFGSITDVKMVVVKNTSSNAYVLQVNAGDTFQIPAGGEFAYAASTAASANKIESLSIKVVSVPATYDYIQYFVYGD